MTDSQLILGALILLGLLVVFALLAWWFTDRPAYVARRVAERRRRRDFNRRNWMLSRADRRRLWREGGW